MRIIVIGAGPVGGIIGGRLAKAGNSVTLVDVNAEHVQAIRDFGLEVDVPDGAFKVNVQTLFPDEITGKFDLAFIAVRSFNTPQVLSLLEPHLNPGARLVSLQNAMNPPLIEKLVGPDHTIGTVVRMSCRLLRPGCVQTNLRGQLFIGHLHGRITPQLESVHALLSSIIPTEITNNIYGLLWSKLTYSCLGTFGSLAFAPLKTFWQNEQNRKLTLSFMAEIVGVGTSAGVRFEPLKEYIPSEFHSDRPYEERSAKLAEMALNWRNDQPSNIAKALKNGLKTEVDYTAGYVAQEGERLGIPTPLCHALIKLIHEIEKGNRQLQPENYLELPSYNSKEA